MRSFIETTQSDSPDFRESTGSKICKIAAITVAAIACTWFVADGGLSIKGTMKPRFENAVAKMVKPFMDKLQPQVPAPHSELTADKNAL